MQLFDFQTEVVEQILKHKHRCLVALDMGLGKTHIAAEVIARVLEDEHAKQAWVICPLSVLEHWARVLATRLGSQTRLEVIRHSKEIRPTLGKLAPSRPRVLLTNYNKLHKLVCCLNNPSLDVVVFDEGHYLANKDSQRSRAAIRLVQSCNPKYILAMTGTPLLNRPNSLFVMLHILNPNVFASYDRFVQDFCYVKEIQGHPRVVGIKNSSKLRQLMDPVLIVLQKQDVLQLPEKRHCIVRFPIKLSNQDLAIHKRIRQSLERGNRGILFSSYSKEFAKLGRLKLPFVLEYMRTLNQKTPGQKKVVFAYHIDFIKELATQLQAHYIVGETPLSKREVLLHQFKTGTNTILVANLLTTAFGVNLEFVRHIILAELTFRPADLYQAEDRAHRIGTRENVLIHYLVAKHSFEEAIIKVLGKKLMWDNLLTGRDTTRYGVHGL